MYPRSSIPGSQQSEHPTDSGLRRQHGGCHFQQWHEAHAPADRVLPTLPPNVLLWNRGMSFPALSQAQNQHQAHKIAQVCESAGQPAGKEAGQPSRLHAGRRANELPVWRTRETLPRICRPVRLMKPTGILLYPWVGLRTVPTSLTPGRRRLPDEDPSSSNRKMNPRM